MDAELHRRQWMLGPDETEVAPGWRSETLDGGLVLSRHPALPARRLVDADGGAWHLLGIAVESGDGDGPAERIRATPAADVVGATAGWAGRWLLIGPTRLLADAGGTMGIYLRDDGDAWWASSSPALLADGAPVRAFRERALRPGEPMDWYAPPASRWSTVRRVLPSQSIALPGGAVEPRPVTLADRLGGTPANLDEPAERLMAGWRGLAPTGPLWLALTAGHDSRLLLATAVAAGVEVTTYTFERPGMSRADREQPPTLARLAGMDHRLIAPQRPRRGVARAFDVHTARHHAGVDRRYLATRQWEAIPDGAVVVRGGVFEIARHFYHRQLPALASPGAAEMSGAVDLAFGLTPAQQARRAGVAAWSEWAAAHPWPHVDWRDRFYLEQRVGGWLSALEQGLDIGAPERVHLANADALLAALLSRPAAEREQNGHHVELIRRLAPELLDLPLNPPGDPRPPPLVTRARIRAGRLRRRRRG